MVKSVNYMASLKDPLEVSLLKSADSCCNVNILLIWYWSDLFVCLSPLESVTLSTIVFLVCTIQKT